MSRIDIDVTPAVRDIRQRLTQVEQSAGSMQAAVFAAIGQANLAGGAPGTKDYASLSAAQAATIGSDILLLRIVNTGAVYEYSLTQPDILDRFQSADGKWWRRAAEPIMRWYDGFGRQALAIAGNGIGSKDDPEGAEFDRADFRAPGKHDWTFRAQGIARLLNPNDNPLTGARAGAGTGTLFSAGGGNRGGGGVVNRYHAGGGFFDEDPDEPLGANKGIVTDNCTVTALANGAQVQSCIKATRTLAAVSAAGSASAETVSIALPNTTRVLPAFSIVPGGFGFFTDVSNYVTNWFAEDGSFRFTPLNNTTLPSPRARLAGRVFEATNVIGGQQVRCDGVRYVSGTDTARGYIAGDLKSAGANPVIARAMRAMVIYRQNAVGSVGFSAVLLDSPCVTSITLNISQGGAVVGSIAFTAGSSIGVLSFTNANVAVDGRSVAAGDPFTLNTTTLATGNLFGLQTEIVGARVVNTPTAAVPPAPSWTTLPSYSGTVKEGQSVTFNTGTIANGTGFYAHFWHLIDGAEVAATSSYVFRSEDVGKPYVLRITVRNYDGLELIYNSTPVTVEAA